MTTLTLLKDIADPAHCPAWAIGPLSFQQNAKLQLSPAFDAEAKLLKHFYDHNNCDTIIDIGCWLGVLALKTYKLVQPKKMILVDAIPMYLRMCRELFKKHDITENVWAMPMCIVSEPEKFDNHFLIDLSNTLHTSNILAKPILMKDKFRVHIPTYSPAVSPAFAALILSDLVTSNTHVKIDIDTMDYDLVKSLVAGSNRPRSMNFECCLFSNELKTKFVDTVVTLRQNNYAVPDLNTIDLTNVALLDLFVSENHWAIMTYKSDSNNITVYEKTITNF